MTPPDERVGTRCAPLAASETVAAKCVPQIGNCTGPVQSIFRKKILALACPFAQRRSAKMLDLIVLGAAAGERTLSATDVECVARNMWVDGTCRPSIHTHWRWNLRCSAKP